MLLDRYLEHHAKREIDTELYRRVATATLADVKDLIAAGANPDAPVFNDTNDDFYAIHRAALNPDIAVLKYIVSLGVDPCRRDFWARQPLSFAVRKNPVEFAKYLVECGNQACHMDDDGMTVFAEAVLNPHEDVLDYLHAHKADINDGAMGLTPIEIALYKGTPERLAYLIRRGASIEYAAQIHGTDAPIENLRILLENGYNPDTVDDEGDVPKRIFDSLGEERRSLFLAFGASARGTPVAEVLMRQVVGISKPNLLGVKPHFGFDSLWDERRHLCELLARVAEAGHGLAALTDRKLLDEYLSCGEVQVSFYQWDNVGMRDEWNACGFLTATSSFDATKIPIAFDDAWRCRGGLTSRMGFFPISVAIGHAHVNRYVGYITTACDGDAVRITRFFLREEFMGLRVEHRCLNMLRFSCKKAKKRLIGMDYVDNGQNGAVRDLLSEAEQLGFFIGLDAPYFQTPIVDGTGNWVFCHASGF